MTTRSQGGKLCYSVGDNRFREQIVKKHNRPQWQMKQEGCRFKASNVVNRIFPVLSSIETCNAEWTSNTIQTYISRIIHHSFPKDR